MCAAAYQGTLVPSVMHLIEMPLCMRVSLFMLLMKEGLRCVLELTSELKFAILVKGKIT